MDIRFVTRNIEMPDVVRDHMEMKLTKLEKFFEKILNSQVEISHSRGMYVVEITSNVNGVIMRGENYAPDLRKAFDKALRSIERQIKRHKEYLKDKIQMKTHDISFDLGEILAEGARQEVEEEEDEKEIVKIKKFPLRPMSPQEATMQMDLLGHSFFVFRNAEEDDSLNVVYRRRSGGYGLIVPQS